MEKNYIKLNVVAIFKNTEEVFFKVENNKRCSNFNNGSEFFKASNGITIYSLMYPSYQNKDKNKNFLVQGEDTRLDDIILRASAAEFSELQKAVDEYNKKFSFPEFVFRISLEDTGTDKEILLKNLSNNRKWKEKVVSLLENYIEDVLEPPFEYNIDIIQINDNTLLTEFELLHENCIKTMQITARIPESRTTLYSMKHIIVE